jgi:hypothetical protein
MRKEFSMRTQFTLVFAALCVACSSDPPPRNDAGTPTADVPVTTDAPTANDTPPPNDAPPPSDTPTPDDTPAPSDGATDASADVPLRNGCPILTDPVDVVGAPPNGDTLADFVRPFVQQYCLRCHSSALMTPEDRHGAPMSFNWDTEAGIRMELPRIRNAVGVANYMPLNNPMPSCDERRRLVRWIDIGAP